MSIRAAIVGPTGYAGFHLIDRLLSHTGVELTALASHREQLPDIREEFPSLSHRLSDEVAQCISIDAEAIAAVADVAFLALPHRAAMARAPELLQRGVKIVDLSADYRLDSPEVYEQTYDHPHEDTANLDHAVYGLPEFHRREIADARLVANPGCYPTAAALAAAPLVQHSLVSPERVIYNAASGVTGTGRKPAAHLHFPEINEGFFPYGQIGGHRHQPEIEQTLTTVTGQSTSVLFVPHLLPVNQGILGTLYLDPRDPNVSEAELFEAYDRAYRDEPFIRVLQHLPNIRHVRDTNYCDLTVCLAGRPDRPTVVAFVALDNLIKGASGQAIENMNLMCELDETAGLG